MTKTVCKGRDSRGRIKKGYRLVAGGLVKTTATRRRKKPAAAPSLASALGLAPKRRKRRAAPKRTKRTAAQLALARRARKVAAKYSPGAQALSRRARTVATRVRAGQAARVVVSVVPEDRAKPPAPSRQRRLPGTRRRRRPAQASFKF